MQNTAIVILSDPLAATRRSGGCSTPVPGPRLKERGRPVELLFQGAGARWPAEIVRPAHPAHALYQAVADRIAGICGGCADVFGATE